ncbi:MAG: hypothetical protein VB814_03160, partial [Pirellulaceae bacterium]
IVRTTTLLRLRQAKPQILIFVWISCFLTRDQNSYYNWSLPGEQKEQGDNIQLTVPAILITILHQRETNIKRCGEIRERKHVSHIGFAGKLLYLLTFHKSGTYD